MQGRKEEFHLSLPPEKTSPIQQASVCGRGVVALIPSDLLKVENNQFSPVATRGSSDGLSDGATKDEERGRLRLYLYKKKPKQTNKNPQQHFVQSKKKIPRRPDVGERQEETNWREGGTVGRKKKRCCENSDTIT